MWESSWKKKRHEAASRTKVNGRRLSRAWNAFSLCFAPHPALIISSAVNRLSFLLMFLTTLFEIRPRRSKDHSCALGSADGAGERASSPLCSFLVNELKSKSLRSSTLESARIEICLIKNSLEFTFERTAALSVGAVWLHLCEPGTSAVHIYSPGAPKTK